jgi:membrane-associated phospholipid phosphatase
MMMKNYFFFIFCLLFHAEARSWSFKEFNEELTSPGQDNVKYVLVTGAAATVVLGVMRTSFVKPFQTQQASTQPLGSSSHYGDLLGQLVPNVLYIGGMGLSGSTLGKNRSMGMMKATAYAAGVTTLLKYTVREPRPDNPNERNSFPSGHTTTAFAFSGYVAAEHGWSWGAPALAMSSFVGFSRINDNRHWLNDVVAGAAIGWSFGWGISKLEQKRRRDKIPLSPIPDSKTPEQDPEYSPVVVPIASSDTLGIGVKKEF